VVLLRSQWEAHPQRKPKVPRSTLKVPMRRPSSSMSKSAGSTAKKLYTNFLNWVTSNVFQGLFEASRGGREKGEQCKCNQEGRRAIKIWYGQAWDRGLSIFHHWTKSSVCTYRKGHRMEELLRTQDLPCFSWIGRTLLSVSSRIGFYRPNRPVRPDRSVVLSNLLFITHTNGTSFEKLFGAGYLRGPTAG
jgi:hypothetical protein